MAVTIRTLSLETLVDEIVDIHNFNVTALADAVNAIQAAINITNGNIDVSTYTIGEIKAKSLISVSGMTIQGGGLTITAGGITIGAGNITALTSNITSARVNSTSSRNSGINLKNYQTFTVAGTIDPTNLNSALITSNGGAYTLSSSFVEVEGSDTYSQEISLFYVPTTGTSNATISGVGSGGSQTITMTPNSTATLRYIGTSWMVLSLNGATIA